MSRLLLASLLAAALSAPAHAAPGPRMAASVALNVPLYTAPQAQNGLVYLTSMQASGPNLFAIDSSTGKVIWRYATQGQITIPPTVGQAQVFVASDIGATHFLRAINSKTGLLVWQYTRTQPPECMCSQASILTGGLLFAQSDGHSLYAFAPNGDAPSQRLWQFPGNGAPLTAPVVADQLVVFGSGDHNVYALDAKTGAVKWTGTTGYVFTAPPLVADGTVVIGDQGGNIDGFDLKSGKALWSDGAGEVDNAAVAQGKTAFVVSQDHSLYALNIPDGQQVWQYTMDDYAEYSPLVAGDLVIAANRAGELVAVDTTTGKRAWQTDLQGTPFSQPILWLSQNAIVLKIGDHDIGAFDAQSGKALWRYATRQVVTAPAADGKSIDVATSGGQVLVLE